MAEVKDKVVTVESLAALHEHNMDSYMTQTDPTGNGVMTIDSIKMGNVLLQPTTSSLNIVFLTEESTES